jgi:hypothetical protein
MSDRDRSRIFVLRLRPLPSVVDPIRALRWALKRLLRDHGFRCISVSEEQQQEEK